ncbi:UNVERIFIED_CONTAM: 3,4-dihydroxy-2-butanone-4-phosphate synthase, partial [Microbacterium sp. SLM126]
MLSTIPELVADLAAGKMVILVDDADRENEGDLVIAADLVTPETINFMATHARGLICLTLTEAHCQRLALPPMTLNNGAAHDTAFTVSIEAASGVTSGISAADRAKTVRTAVAAGATAQDLVQPGHIFPLRAREGGVLMRPGHTEAGCDLAGLAGLSRAAVICEIMNDDGTMARLPDLAGFASRHGLKMGTIADLITYRSRTEVLVERLSDRRVRTAYGIFRCTQFRDRFGGDHFALACGRWSPEDLVLVGVHEGGSVLDLMDLDVSWHSRSLPDTLAKLQTMGRGVALLVNCDEARTATLTTSPGAARTSSDPNLEALRL